MNKFTKKIVTVLSLIAIFGSNLNAMQNFRAVDKKEATILQDGKNKQFCPVCGMTLPMFYKTNHAAKDGDKTHQYCSVVCQVEDEVVNNKKLTHHQVVDTKTLKFIDSTTAFFIVGSSKPGTMSVVSKYAFGSKKDAINFQKTNGGKLMMFEEVYALVKKSQSKDMKATKQRQAKAAKKGAKIYSKFCTKTDKRFVSVANAKTFIKTTNLCENIKGKKKEKMTQAVALFLSNK